VKNTGLAIGKQEMAGNWHNRKQALKQKESSFFLYFAGQINKWATLGLDWPAPPLQPAPEPAPIKAVLTVPFLPSRLRQMQMK